MRSASPLLLYLIMIAGLATMCPERRDDVVSLGLKSIVSGTLTTCLLGAIVGVLS
jgi:concentrative nucleoside transporter, CNT family